MVSFVFFVKQKTAYEMRISDWSSDVCSSDLLLGRGGAHRPRIGMEIHAGFFELKAEISEQRAHFGFGVVEQAFVDHAVHAPRQHRVTMRLEDGRVGNVYVRSCIYGVSPYH